jgi:hypothetical protein
METLGNKSQAKIGYKFYCEVCHYGTCKKSGYDSHLMTAKHKKQANGNVLETFGNKSQAIFDLLNYECTNCSKVFKNRSGLWKHKQKCNVHNNCCNENTNTISNNIIDKDELIITLLKQNAELLEIVKNGTNNHSNNTN